jgi:hypothetical protein
MACKDPACMTHRLIQEKAHNLPRCSSAASPMPNQSDKTWENVRERKGIVKAFLD